MNNREEQVPFPEMASGNQMDPSDSFVFHHISSAQPVTHIVNMSDLAYTDGGSHLTEKVLLNEPMSYTTLETAVSDCAVHREGGLQQHMQVEEEHIEGLLKLCSSMAPKNAHELAEGNTHTNDGNESPGSSNPKGSYDQTTENPPLREGTFEGTGSSIHDEQCVPAVDLLHENEILKEQFQQLHEQIQKLVGGKPHHGPASVVTAKTEQGCKEAPDTLTEGRVTIPQSEFGGGDEEITETNKSVYSPDFEMVMADLEQLKKSMKEKDETIDKMKRDAMKKSEVILKKHKELKTVKEKLKTVDSSQDVNTEIPVEEASTVDLGELDPITAAALEELGDLMCSDCNIVFCSTIELEEHKKTHENVEGERVRIQTRGRKNYFSCDDCNKLFSSESYLREHAKRFHGFGGSLEDIMEESLVTDDAEFLKTPVVPYGGTTGRMDQGKKQCKLSCEMCKKTFSTGSNLHKHRRNVHKLARAKGGVPITTKECKVCGRQFDRLSAMYRHMKKAHDQASDEEVDPLSEKGTSNQIESPKASEEVEGRNSEKTFQCPKCRDVFSTISNLYRHKRNVHGIESEEKPRAEDEDDSGISDKYAIFDESGKKRYKCDQCTTILNGTISLFRHLRKHGGPKQFQCNQCGKKFAQKSSLAAHEKIHTGIRPHLCNLCGKSFLEKKCFAYHMRNHTGDKPHKCDDCDASFVIKSKLERHKRQHCTDRPHQCDTCGKCFALVFYLKQHKRTHSGLRPFSCEICDRRFTQRTNLARHMRTHTGEKPYQCEDCGKSFATFYSLENHKRTHTGEKPFVCPKCPLSFAERNSLKRHLRIHSGEKPYNCDVCGRAFSRKYDVKKHKRIHTGEKAYYCRVCGSGFNQKGDLENHLHTHAPKQEESNEDLYRQGYEYSVETINNTQTLTIVPNTMADTHTASAIYANPVLTNNMPNTNPVHGTLNLQPAALPGHQTVLHTLQPHPVSQPFTYITQTLSQQGQQTTPWLMTFQNINDGHS